MQFTAKARGATMQPMEDLATLQSAPFVTRCVLMRAGTSRGPFFLRSWLPEGDAARDQALIGAIGASDPLQVDGVGGGSTLTSKVAIVSRSVQPDCDVDYLFAQVGVGQKSVDTRPNCGNMLSGVAPFAIEQGLVPAQVGQTRVRVFNVNTRSRIDVTVQTPGGRVAYEGTTGIDGVAGTAAAIQLDFLDAWGAVTGAVFPTGLRIDTLLGVPATCIDAAMPLMIVRAADLGLSGRETPAELDADRGLLARLEAMRLLAGERMGLGDVSASVVPKPVLVSPGEDADSITSRYFTPRRCHASHAVTGAIGVAAAFALPGTVASSALPRSGPRSVSVLHPQGRIAVAVDIEGEGEAAAIRRAALVRTARKIFEGELHVPGYVFSKPLQANAPAVVAARTITLVVPTAAGGGNDAMARTIAGELGRLLGQRVLIDNRAGADGSIASEFVAAAAPDGQTLMWGYTATHAMNPALQKLRYDPVADFAPVGLVGQSPTLLVVHPDVAADGMLALLALLRTHPERLRYASAGQGTAPQFAAELFRLNAGVALHGVACKGSAEAIAETLAGRTQIMFPSLYTALPHVQAGRLRALAVAGPQRSPRLPAVPTLHEAGIDGVEVGQWYGLFAPAATAPERIAHLNAALRQVLSQREIVQRLQSHGAEVESGAPEALGMRVQAELSRWQAVVRRAQLRAD
jgi:2-methylaconitate cis-trans-isomerase PrpF/tripartite-type tricarboxylate transporter receptor subunit TctC